MREWTAMELGTMKAMGVDPEDCEASANMMDDLMVRISTYFSEEDLIVPDHLIEYVRAKLSVFMARMLVKIIMNPRVLVRHEPVPVPVPQEYSLPPIKCYRDMSGSYTWSCSTYWGSLWRHREPGIMGKWSARIRGNNDPISGCPVRTKRDAMRLVQQTVAKLERGV